MNQSTPQDLAEQRRIDQIADQFERAWRDGNPKRIESFLDGHDAIRGPLLIELVRIEREMRENQGEDVTVSQYRDQFPDEGEAVDEAFSVDSELVSYADLVDEFERIWMMESSLTAESFLRLRSSDPDPDTFAKILAKETQLRKERYGGESSSRRVEAIPSNFGRYEVKALISKGGFGEVYRAVDPKLGREVAIKTPRLEHALDSAHRKAFEEEAKLICRLEHAHIVPVYDFGMADSGRPYLVCKLIDASPLSDQIAVRPFGFHETVEICSAIGKALHHAHQSNVVHRDVKPANILLDSRGHAWLTDFGLGLEGPQTNVEKDHSGTITYWSPEQASGKGHLLDGRSDIFSLGIIMYRMITGVHPFAADTNKGVWKRIMEAEVKPPRQCNDHIPPELEEVCLKALRRDPTERYSTAADMVAALDEVSTYVPSPIDTSHVEVEQEVAALMERLAINVHEIWASKRISEGWIVGPARSDAKKTHPDLVPYEQLSKIEQDYDRDVVDSVIRAAIAMGARIDVPEGDKEPKQKDCNH